MKFAKLMIGFLMITAFANTAHAAGAHGLVQCSDAKVKNGPVIFSYLISANASQRLASDVLLVQNSVPQIIPSFQIAQYASSSLALYLMADDESENITMSFAAALPNAKAFPGVLSFYTNNKVSKNQAVNCKLVPQ